MKTLFVIGFLLALTPGPDFFLMAKHTLSFGRKMGYFTLLGNRLSLIGHMTFAILGLSLILQKSITVFLIIRALGASYLIYLGIKNLVTSLKRKSTFTTSASHSDQIKPFQALQRGFFSNLLNPKVSLFFLSIFPQFTSAHQLAHSPLQVGLAIFLGNCSWYVPILFVIGLKTIRTWVQKIQQGLGFIFGAIFIGYGFDILWNEFKKLGSISL